MDYFVTGGTGFIGTKLINLLVNSGHEITALTRSVSNANHLPEEVTVVEGDITDKETLRGPMTGVDGVFHMAAWYFIGPGRRAVDKATRINVDGTRNVMQLIDELDIPKGVYTSSVVVHGDTGGNIVDETHRPDPPGICVYFDSKWRAHYEVVQPMIDDGLPVVVVQPGAVYGPGDKEYGSVRQPFFDWLAGDLPMLPREFTFSFDHVDDVAQAHLTAMNEGKIGEEYIIANEPREVVEIFDMAAEMTGISPPRSVSPVWFNLLSKVLAPVDRVWPLPEGFQPEMFRAYGGTKNLVDNSKAKKELGIEHRPFEDGLREYLTWELEQHGMDTEPLERIAENEPANSVS